MTSNTPVRRCRCDYVKIDWCDTKGMDVAKACTLLHEAQLAAGRPIVHSLCSWGAGEPWKWAASIEAYVEAVREFHPVC